jgi:hypothetical protein
MLPVRIERSLVTFAIAMVICCEKRAVIPESASLLDAKMRCAQRGQQWLANFAKQHESLGENVSRGQFTYSNQLDTCLCYYDVSYRGSVTSQVRDILGNQVILSLMTGPDAAGKAMVIGRDTRAGAVPPRDLDDFDARVKALGFNPDSG